jgi:hypothetical protein
VFRFISNSTSAKGSLSDPISRLGLWWAARAIDSDPRLKFSVCGSDLVSAGSNYWCGLLSVKLSVKALTE